MSDTIVYNKDKYYIQGTEYRDCNGNPISMKYFIALRLKDKKPVILDINGNEAVLPYNHPYIQIANFGDGLFAVTKVKFVPFESYCGQDNCYEPDYSPETHKVACFTQDPDLDNDQGTWCYINEQGKEVIPPKFIFAYPHNRNRAVVAKGEWEYRADWQGQNDSKQIGWWHKDCDWGVIDKNGKEIIPCKYERINEISNYYSNDIIYCVFDGDKWGFMDINGKWICEPFVEGCDLDVPFTIEKNGCFEYGLTWRDNSKELVGVYNLIQNKNIIEKKYDTIYFEDAGTMSCYDRYPHKNTNWTCDKYNANGKLLETIVGKGKRK